MRALLVMGLIIVLGSTPVTAVQNKRLSPGEFLALVAGKTLLGEYQTGEQWQERFIGELRTVYRDSEKNGNGTVSRKGNFVCFKYQSDVSMSGGCFEVWQRGENCFDFYGTGLGSGNTNRTTASERQKLFGLGWTARAWLTGNKSTCVSEQIS